ncbi:testosterone 17-beta-dehydrogenase 3 isoform X2 [Colossoma macropomum]|uniref:testosterone 17-beta-dehydrogenase 3 isoform X1 n=1 Tax=Colossoma macropomum TaxID=42526 RepID=UPI001864AD4D|nr:testosterone 17-beta-dehydrogenase 3 isoform X1 [Colossoma macropomum]XP_036434261.1 testosterone 17-beta-dehydrogenase 3 isoform X2 [Colossoma macropomum]
MALIELIFTLVGACVVLFCCARLAHVLMKLYPRVWYPLPENFFTSMGKWAVITGASDGIGKAYAQELARHGLNVVIISRTKEKLDRLARDIEVKTGVKVITIVTDFTKEDIYGVIKENIQGLDVAILVNNVGKLPTFIPCRLLEIDHLEEKMYQVINCNVKTTVKMCRIILPGMVERGRGIILTVSSGIAKIPCPIYTLYAATKVFLERFSQGLQAEYRSDGILFQTVSPFGVSTAMTGYQKTDFFTFTAEEFVRNSLMYLKAGEQTYGSIVHAVLGWVIQAIPTWVLRSEAFHHNFQEFVKKKMDS